MSPSMLDMPEVACQRGHATHDTLQVSVRLGGPTGYHDYPDIPARLAREFEMSVFDWKQYLDLDDPRYCPASDVVSQTVEQLGVWEPRETILASSACRAAAPGSTVVDFGCQVGWFTSIALAWGLDVLAVDADTENLRVLVSPKVSSEPGGAPPWRLVVRHQRVDAVAAAFPIETDRRVALAKIDIEGAEADAVRMLWPLIEAGQVDHLMVEVTPPFAPGYPELVCRLVDAGYRAWQLPPKATPPHRLDDLPGDLEAWRLDTLSRDKLAATVAGWSQEDLWFALPDAPWG